MYFVWGRSVNELNLLRHTRCTEELILLNLFNRKSEEAIASSVQVMIMPLMRTV